MEQINIEYPLFYEYFRRYIFLVSDKKKSIISYDFYKNLRQYIKEYPLEYFKDIIIHFKIDTLKNEIQCDLPLPNSKEDFIQNIRYLSSNKDIEFGKTIIDWYKNGYPYNPEFISKELFYNSIQLDSILKKNDEYYTHIVDIKNTNNVNKKQEEKNMNTNFNFGFGVLKAGYVRMSPYGIAVESNGTWKAFDRNTGNIVDVGDFAFKMDGAFFKMPVAINEVHKGDVLMFKNEPVYVIDKEGEGFKVVAIADNEQKVIMPVTNIFGFNYMTKIVSIFDNMVFNKMMSPSADQPFGNMMPLMMMQMFSEGDSFNMGNDMGKMMMMSMMMGGQNPMMNMFNQFTNISTTKEEKK